MRKDNKLRPYRVDYFDIEEMKDNDLALVRSAVIRSTTCDDAVYALLDAPGFDFFHGHEYPSLVIIRSYRFYKKLTHKKDVYKAVEDLFSGNMAVKIMDQIEAYRLKVAGYEPPVVVTQTIVTPADPTVEPIAHAAVPDPTGHVTRYSDSSLYDEVCTSCGATDADGDKLRQPCPAQGALDVGTTPVAPVAPTTGPDSPATQAVVADLKGMIAHDAHEQAMDTFVPTVVPEGKSFPELRPLKDIPLFPAPASTEPLIEPDQAVGCSARPPFAGTTPQVEETQGGVTWTTIATVLAVIAIIGSLYVLLHH